MGFFSSICRAFVPSIRSPLPGITSRIPGVPSLANPSSLLPGYSASIGANQDDHASVSTFLGLHSIQNANNFILGAISDVNDNLMNNTSQDNDSNENVNVNIHSNVATNDPPPTNNPTASTSSTIAQTNE